MVRWRLRAVGVASWGRYRIRKGLLLLLLLLLQLLQVSGSDGGMPQGFVDWSLLARKGGHEGLVMISKREGPVLRSHHHPTLRGSDGGQSCPNRWPSFYSLSRKGARTERNCRVAATTPYSKVQRYTWNCPHRLPRVRSRVEVVTVNKTQGLLDEVKPNRNTKKGSFLLLLFQENRKAISNLYSPFLVQIRPEVLSRRRK